MQIFHNPTFTKAKQALARISINFFVLMACLFLFDVLNFSITFYALKDIFKQVTFGLFLANFLAIAFNAIDLTPVLNAAFAPKEPNAFLTAAWVLGTFLNACVTYWGLAIAKDTDPMSMSTTTIAIVLTTGLLLAVRMLIVGGILFTNPK